MFVHQNVQKAGKGENGKGGVEEWEGGSSSVMWGADVIVVLR